ncbi:protein of unknown function [Pararobbsia alpina]
MTVGDADHRIAEVVFLVAERVIHRAIRRARDALGDIARAAIERHGDLSGLSRGVSPACCACLADGTAGRRDGGSWDRRMSFRDMRVKYIIQRQLSRKTYQRRQAWDSIYVSFVILSRWPRSGTSAVPRHACR